MKLALKISFFVSIISLFLLSTKAARAADVAKVIFAPAGQPVTGKPLKVDVIIDSNVDVNAAQLSISYPQDQFTLNGVDSVASKFSIKAEETLTAGIVKIARGNVQPLKGKNLLVSLVLIPKTSTASISKLNYVPGDSLVMSKDNVNVLSGSQVLTIKPITPTPVKGSSKGFTSIFSQAVKEFFKGIFGK